MQQIFTILFACSFTLALPGPPIVAIGGSCGGSDLSAPVCQSNASCVFAKTTGPNTTGVCREVFSYGDKPCGGPDKYPTRCAPYFRCNALEQGDYGECVDFGGIGPVVTGDEGSRCGAVFGDDCQEGLECSGDEVAEGVCVKKATADLTVETAAVRIVGIGDRCGSGLADAPQCQSNASCVLTKEGDASGVCREVFAYGGQPCGGPEKYPSRCATFYRCLGSNKTTHGKCVNFGGIGPVIIGNEGSRCGAVFGNNCKLGLKCSGNDRAEGACVKA